MSEFIARDGVRLHYTTQGDGGTPVICLHCLGADASSWDGVWSMCGDSFRWIGLDLRGHGRSSRMLCKMTAEILARDVLDLADALELKEFSIAGHSMGGKVAMRLAALAPKRILSLILIGSVGPGPVPLERSIMEDFVSRAHDFLFVRDFFRPWFRHWPCAEVNAYLAKVTITPQWALKLACEMAIYTDIAREVGVLSQPVLAVIGSNDPVYGIEYQQRAVVPHLANSRQVLISDCGHGMILERPREIALHIDSFLVPSLSR
jgi:pimeloyl-ACP methyl ester carboxylesterase